MDALTAISIAEIGAGACIMMVATLMGLRIQSSVPREFRLPWTTLVAIIHLFLLAYVLYLAVLFWKPLFPLEPITGALFLAGSIFVVVMLRMVQRTLRHLQAKDREQTELLEEIERQGGALAETKGDLEREVAELRAAERALKESEEKYRSLVESTEDSIYVVDGMCRYLHMNRKHIQRLTGTTDDVTGRAYEEFHNDKETAVFKERVSRIFATGRSFQSEHQSRRDGNFFLQTFSPVVDASGAVTAVTVVSKNISERKKVEEELRHFSFTDELTGLTNRRGFFALAEHRLKLAHRLEEPQALLYLDLDNLKEINDVFGHHEGDLALVEIAKILKTTFRESDIVARIGGDEFAIGPAAMDGQLMTAQAERLEEALSVANSAPERLHKLSLSVGRAVFDPETPCTIDELLARADRAMYDEKKRKREIREEA